MLIPYGTDAPLYRPPWGTFSLIVANVTLFLIQDIVTPESLYILSFGDGFHPVQWVLSAFAHADWMHLIGNMIFLFSFGMVVESMMKLRYFLMLYFAIAILESVIVQTMMLGAWGGGALGASGAIYGLMMVASICAPGKNIRWFWMFYYSRSTTFEVPVLINGVFYFMFDFGSAMFSGFAISTPFLHAIGGLVGIGVGIVAYRLDWFQLDGGDVWSRLKEILGHESRRETKPEKPAAARPIRQHRFGSLEQQVVKLDEYLASRRYKLALMKLAQIESEYASFQLSESQLVRLINVGTQREDWNRVLQRMDEYLGRFERHAMTIKLNQARIQIVILGQPAAAMATLGSIRPSGLSAQQRQRFYLLRRRIRISCKQASAPAWQATHSPFSVS